MLGFKNSTSRWPARLMGLAQRGNTLVWVALISITVVTFVVGTFWGTERASAFSLTLTVESSSPEDSTYDATGEAPILVALEMNKDEFLALSPGGREALQDFWQNYILELSSQLIGAIRFGLGVVSDEEPAASIRMIIISWTYPKDYQMIVETTRKTYKLPPREIVLPQPAANSQRFLIQRVSFVMTFISDRRAGKILSAFEHSLASPAWYEKPELRKAIRVDTKVDKRVPDGLVILTFTDLDGGTTTIQAKLPLPASGLGAELTQVMELVGRYSSIALRGYLNSLFKSGGFDKALVGHDRVTRMILKIKRRVDDWKGELVTRSDSFVTVIPIPPPFIGQIYFFGF